MEAKKTITPPNTGSHVKPSAKIIRLEIQNNPVDECRVEFDKWIVRHFKVETVNDLPFDIRTYCDFMECFSAGWQTISMKILNKLLEQGQ